MTDQPEDLFVFNGVDGDSGDYLWPSMTADQVVALAQGEDPDEVQKEAVQRAGPGHTSFGLMEGMNPKSLADSGWGVIFAQDADPAVREALQPLLQHRQAQAGERFREFSGSNGYLPDERKRAFLRRHKVATSGPVDPDRMPYYLLIVGSPEAISCEFQSQLDLQYAVGRLHFDTVDEYDHYARSVIASERGEVKASRRLGLFGPRNPKDRATTLSADGLIAGIERYVRDQLPAWSLDVRTAEEATKAELGEILGGPQTPAVLLTASHGMGFRYGDPRQFPHQGALLCQDWPGPRSGRVSPDLYFSADDLGDSAQLSGLIAFFFACYGGGVPRYAAFHSERSTRPKQLTPQAFFSRLPLRMLGHPRGGALATVAHIERAWNCSFYDPEIGHNTNTFASFMKRLLQGHPIGSAMEYFGIRYGELSSDLLQNLEDIKYGDTSISKVQVANDWTAVNDARNYIILGDPAVRLPIADAAEATER